MNRVLGHDSALYRLYDHADEMNFVMNDAPGTGSIARPVNQQYSVLPLYHVRPLLNYKNAICKLKVLIRVRQSMPSGQALDISSTSRVTDPDT